MTNEFPKHFQQLSIVPCHWQQCVVFASELSQFGTCIKMLTRAWEGWLGFTLTSCITCLFLDDNWSQDSQQGSSQIHHYYVPRVTILYLQIYQHVHRVGQYHLSLQIHRTISSSVSHMNQTPSLSIFQL